MREKVEILERGGQMVLAAHRTPVGSGLTAVTVETVTLDPPNRMGFRLLRGPVPHVIETFAFDETADGTRLGGRGPRLYGRDQDRERTPRTGIVTPPLLMQSAP